MRAQAKDIGRLIILDIANKARRLDTRQIPLMGCVGDGNA